MAPLSPAALIISTTVPDGPAAFIAFNYEVVFLAILILIGIGGPSSSGSLDM